jgi:hypothetical protein
MKVFAPLAVLFALLLAACAGSGDDGGFLNSDQPAADVVIGDSGAVYHDAIDSSPAADPDEREAAYFEVAGRLASDSIPESSRDLRYELVWEEAIDGNARIQITGYFQEGGQWLEERADFQMTRTAGGTWILENEVVFDLTQDQKRLQQATVVAAEEEAQRQEEIVLLTAVLEAFDSIVAEVAEPEIIPDPDRPGVDGFKFHLGFDNPTTSEHSLDYRIDWVEVKSNAEGPKCWREYESRGASYEVGSEEIPASTAVSIEVEPLSGYDLMHCDGLRIEDVRVSVTQIDGYEREKAEARLVQLQTSPQ